MLSNKSSFFLAEMVSIGVSFRKDSFVKLPVDDDTDDEAFVVIENDLSGESLHVKVRLLKMQRRRNTLRYWTGICE